MISHGVLQAILKLRNGVGGLRNGTRVPKECFPAVKFFTRKACSCKIWLWRVSQLISQLRNELLGCEMSHVCLGSISQGVGLWLRNDFAEVGLFRSKTSISQHGPFGFEMVS